MAEVELRVGAKIDMLTPDEFRSGLHDSNGEWFHELASGVRWMRYVQNLPATPTAYTAPGPELGFAWSVKMISTTLTAADSLAAYLGEGPNNRLIGFTPTATQPLQVLTFSSNQVIALGGEQIYLTTTGTGHLTTVMLAAVQVPQEQLAKLLI